MKNMTHPTLQLKWYAFDKTAIAIVDQLEEKLDHRLTALSDVDNNKRILSAFLAYRGTPFQVLLGSLAQKDKAAVKAVLEALKGEVLLTRDNNVYEFRDEYSFRKVSGKIKTINQLHVPVTNKHGAIYSDGTSGEVAFVDIANMGYIKPSRVRIVAPYHHWAIFFDGKPAPSKQWIKLEEIETDQPQRHEDILDKVVKFAMQSACLLVRYGSDSFLCESPNICGFHINNTITRLSGKHGQRPLLEITDTYQRKEMSWGSAP